MVLFILSLFTRPIRVRLKDSLRPPASTLGATTTGAAFGAGGFGARFAAGAAATGAAAGFGAAGLAAAGRAGGLPAGPFAPPLAAPPPGPLPGPRPGDFRSFTTCSLTPPRLAAPFRLAPGRPWRDPAAPCAAGSCHRVARSGSS